MTEQDFKMKFDALLKVHGDKYGFETAHAFLDLHLKWATAVQSTDPAQALQQYRLAEDCQRTIGTYATGSGEGLASMFALYEIMGERAELEEKIANSTKESSEHLKHLEAALAIWSEIRRCPNDLWERTPARQQIDKLQARIAKLK
jgi:hypothetical protein